jgi:probable dihydroxyacetone kinase regulator
MSGALITKKAMAESIKDLMKTISLSKISVQNIVDNCNLNRQTFYYHFKDKFELVNWVYFSEVIECIQGSITYVNWDTCLSKILEHLYNNKFFYINAISVIGQNSFSEYFNEKTNLLLYKVVEELSEGINISLEDKKFISNFYTQAFLGVVYQWLNNGVTVHYKVMVEKISTTMKDCFVFAIQRFSQDPTSMGKKLSYL